MREFSLKPDEFAAWRAEYEGTIRQYHAMSTRGEAEKAATHCGAAGLLLLQKALQIALPLELEREGSVQALATKTLGQLLACKEIIETHPAEYEIVKEKFPEDDIDDPGYWNEMINSLCELGKISPDEKAALRYQKNFMKRYVLATDPPAP